MTFRHPLANGALAWAAILAAPTLAAEPDIEALLNPGSTDDLISAFREVCFDHREDWNAMRQAAEGSRLGFEPIGKPKKSEADFLAFPLMVSLKQSGKDKYVCLIQSQVAEGTTTEQLSESLRGSDPQFADLQFEQSDDRLAAPIAHGGKSARVIVDVAASDFLPIAQIAYEVR